MMRRSPSLSGPTRQSESRGHAPSGTMAAFDEWLECAGAALARCLAERFAADEAVSWDWRMKEWLLSCAIGQRRLAWPLSHHATCGAPLFLRERDAGADLATVQKMVGHESVTTTAGYDRRGMRPGAEPPISCMCHFSRGRPERAAGESIAASASCPKPVPYDQVTMLERKLVSGCSPKRVRSLFGRMDGSNRTVGPLTLYAFVLPVTGSANAIRFLPQFVGWANRIRDIMNWWRRGESDSSS
jgi:hypothetical protein